MGRVHIEPYLSAFSGGGGGVKSKRFLGEALDAIAGEIL